LADSCKEKAARSAPRTAPAGLSPCPSPDIPAKDGQTGDISGAHVHVESVHKTGILAGFVYGSLPLANSAIRLWRTAVETAASMPPLRGSTTAGNSIYIRPVTPPVRPLLPPDRGRVGFARGLGWLSSLLSPQGTEGHGTDGPTAPAGLCSFLFIPPITLSSSPRYRPD
jgi:hypothetical protein